MQYEEVFTPSYHGALCRHNGEHPGYEIACDECEHFLTCFPDWEIHTTQSGYDPGTSEFSGKH